MASPRLASRGLEQGFYRANSMHLTNWQHKNLKAYLEYRDRPPSWIGYIKRSWRVYLLIFASFGLVAALDYALEFRELSLVMVGMLAGLLLRDFGVYRKFLQVWPLLDAIFDWEYMKELEASHQRRQELMDEGEI
jgi:hypothetical protein